MPYGGTLQIPPTNVLVLAAKQESHKKAYLLTKNIEEFSGKSSGESWASRQKKDKTERVTGLGRKLREEIVKWNQMTALRFQTGGRHQTSPASLRGQTVQQHFQQHLFCTLFIGDNCSQMPRRSQ